MMHDYCPEWTPEMVLPPAQEKRLIRFETKQFYNAKYRFERIIEGRPFKDGYTPEQRLEYWANYYAKNRDARNAKRRELYHYRRYLQGSVSFLTNVLTGHPLTGENDGVKRETAEEKPITLKEAAAHLSARVGVEVSQKAIIQWAKRGRIPTQQLVGQYLFFISELDAWLKAGRVELDTSRALDAMRRIPRMS
ncbi:MAG: helix-turn-helix domain-containing protein [Spirochaetia bacterium]|jgi:hypothetical protein